MQTLTLTMGPLISLVPWLLAVAAVAQPNPGLEANSPQPRRVDLSQPLPARCSALQVQPSPGELRQLAPTGELRVTINTGNFVLTQTAASGVVGLSPNLTQLMGRQLGVPIAPALVSSAGAAYQEVAEGRADLGFFGLSENRASGKAVSGSTLGVSYSSPYIEIFGSYAVRNGSSITRNSQVDQPGNTIVVGKNSDYNLWLIDNLRHARVVQAPTSPEVTSFMLANDYSIGAGIRNQLLNDAASTGKIRVLDGSFMVIQQALATGRGRPQAVVYLDRFVRAVISSGCLQDLVVQNRLRDATIPPGP
jgi:polar amino acid transport system substrate-binding protein